MLAGGRETGPADPNGRRRCLRPGERFKGGEHMPNAHSRGNPRKWGFLLDFWGKGRESGPDYPPGGPSQRDWGSVLGSARSDRSARGTVLRWRLAICTVQTVTILTLGAPTMRLASAARRLSTPAISTWLRSSGALTSAPFTSRTKASWMKASWSRTLSAAAGEPAVRRLEI